MKTIITEEIRYRERVVQYAQYPLIPYLPEAAIGAQVGI